MIVDQPTEGTANSYFEVDIVMVEDDDDSNDWTMEGGDLTKTGLFGILLPEGWTVQDNIELHVETADSLPDGAGGYVYATSDHDADYVITYNEGQTQRLNDSTSTPPTGYYWWGATSADPVDMAFFDSLYFTVKIFTDDQEGEFFLQYAIGDVDDWKRNPYDIITDPLPINISAPSGVSDLLSETSLSLYPNPSYGHLNISLEKFSGEPVDVTIYNIRGKEVMKTRITSAQTTFDIVDFAPGTYVIRMESGDETATRKFVRN